MIKGSGFAPSAFAASLRAVVFLSAFSLLFLSCDSGGRDDGNDDTVSVVDVSYPAGSSHDGYYAPVTKVTSDNNPLRLTGLTGQNVFLVKANVSSLWKAGGVGLTGSVESFTVNDDSYTVSGSMHPVSPSSSRIAAGKRAVSGRANGITRLDHEAARKLSSSALPPRISRARSVGRSAASGTGPSYSFNQGDTKSFWVQDGAGSWLEVDAVLRSVGAHCYIWVPAAYYDASSDANNDNRITAAQAVALRDKFEAMYPLVTHLFGYENGGGLAAGAENYGGVDGDPRISVLVYDIGEDYTAVQDNGILGFFWGKDYFAQNVIDGSPDVFGTGVKTNLSEIFYVDSHFTDCAPDFIYSTLIHEYQHMIFFARKKLPSAANPNGLAVDTWFDEMLSMLSEDAIGPKIDIDSNIFPLNSRMPYYLGNYYSSGVTDWLGGDGVYASYASAYAFGAFLARNYGGATLIKSLLDCPYANREAVNYAIDGTANSSGFDSVFRRYAEALVFSGQALAGNAALMSFDRSVTKTITVAETPVTYTFEAFDIWNMPNEFAASWGGSADSFGPLVWVLGDYSLRPYGLDLQSDERWQGVNGTLEIEFDLPLMDEVEMYVMVR